VGENRRFHVVRGGNPEEERPRLPWMPLQTYDFLNDRRIRLMTPAAVGLYATLLCHQWNDGPLPLEIADLAKIIGWSEADVLESWHLVEPCFARTAAGWVNDDLAATRRKKEREYLARAKGGRTQAAKLNTSRVRGRS